MRNFEAVDMRFFEEEVINPPNWRSRITVQIMCHEHRRQECAVTRDR